MEIRFEEQEESIEVYLKGHLSFDTADPFRVTCLESLNERNVIFNLRDLDFVGSSGIGILVSTIEDLEKSNNCRIQFREMKPEFKKIFTASSLDFVNIIEEKFNES